jgi:hypothetical protein
MSQGLSKLFCTEQSDTNKNRKTSSSDENQGNLIIKGFLTRDILQRSQYFLYLRF